MTDLQNKNHNQTNTDQGFFTPALLELRQKLLDAGMDSEAASFYLGKATAVVGEILASKLDQVLSTLDETEFQQFNQLSDDEKTSRLEELFLRETRQTIDQFRQDISLKVIEELHLN